MIDFSNNFEQRLKVVPQSVARGALNILARMAGGEDAAFSGAVRLRACPSVRRHRITGHRLLFRLLPDRIQVLDLIPKTRNILYPSRKQRRQSGRRGAERNRATAPPAPHSINVRTEPAASSLGADGSR